MTTRSGKADRSTVHLSVSSAISPPCSDLAMMVLGQSCAGLAKTHLESRRFSTFGHDLDHEHNLLIESNRRGVMGNLGRSRPDHPAVDGSRVFVKRKPHADYEYRERLVHPRRVPTVCYLRHPTLLSSRKGFDPLFYYALPRHRSFSGPSTQRRELSRAVRKPLALSTPALTSIPRPPPGLPRVSPLRVEDGAAPGPDLDVAVLGQLSEPPVGLGDRQRSPRCGHSGRDLTALPDRLQQFPLPFLLGEPDRPTLTKSCYTTREQPERWESDPEVGREDPPHRRHESDQKHPREPHRQTHRERGRDPRPRAHFLHLAPHKLTPASVPPHTMPHSTPHVRPAAHLWLLSRSLCQF